MALSRTAKVIVDDVDSRVQYSQQWFVDNTGKTNNLGNFGPTFGNTLHGVNTSASLKFDFIGTSITLFGTTDIRQHRGSADPTCECFIDGVSIGATNPFRFAENNWPLCGNETLADGAHTLTVNVNSRGQTFWVDYLAFTPSPIVSTANEIYQIQDTDPGIQYDSNWQSFATVTQLADQKGSSVSFSFFGSQLSWFGIIPGEPSLSQSPSLATYTIDGNLPATPFAIRSLPRGSSTLHNERLFQTPVLLNGLHTISVTYEGERGLTPLTLDYLLIQNGTGIPGAPTTLTASTTTTPTSSTLPPSTTPSSLGLASNNERRTNVAAIVGGLLGVFALLIICAILYRYFKNREKPSDTKSNSNKIQPFVQPPPMIQRQPTPDSRSLGSNRSPDDPFRTEAQDTVQDTIIVRQPQPRRNQRPVSRPVGERPRQVRQSMPPPNSPATAGPSSASDPTLAGSRLDEDVSYYGGYQTWAQNKALEAEASKGLNRDSYM
ncbi:hypothetical protein CVT24_010064 [Panaeolus cyanescens]|uniref:Transmembrane protein n=1 Tax=Panaeolus cyanescens TaxID=181874 RepID=A0A409W9D9_9AGAR|nr:hypothetical protein CVT24_010064 [Panaeolus cyanescens]